MGKTNSPLPDTDCPFEHEHDIGFVPLIVFLGARTPSDALERFLFFSGERQIERVISDSPRRVATAWLGKDRMLGGEVTSRTPPQSNQIHAATIHWRIDADQVGWVRTLYIEPLDARASRNRLEIATTSEIAFLVHAPETRIEQIERDHWRLPGLSVRVETNAGWMDVQPRESLFEIRYAVASGQPITCTLKCEGD
jgi:hypothetical protein